MFRMIGRKTLKRLTRFGLCFYIFSYCMAFTVCAESYPSLEAGAGDAGITAPEAIESEAPAVDEAETPVENPGTETGTAEPESESPEEPEMLGAGSADPDPDEVAYNGTSVSGLWWQIWNNVGASGASHLDGSYAVALTEDITLDDGNITTGSWQYNSRVGTVTVNGNGHIIKGGRGINLENNTDLEDFRAYHYLTFKNAVFKDFDSGIFVDNWVNVGDRKNTFSFINCTFEGNSGSSGTVFYSIQEDDVTFENCTFKNNAASGSGGVIYLYYPGSLSVEGCKFINNTAGNYGGAIAVTGNRSIGIRNNNLFQQNTAKKGGAIYDNVSSGNSYYITQSQFLNNTATDSNGGGAVYKKSVDTSCNKISGSVFLKNSQPEIVAESIDDKTNFNSFIGGNWFGGTVDQAVKNPKSTKPSVLLTGGGEGVYSWKLLNMERWTTSDQRSLYFDIYAASKCFSNGTVEYYSRKESSDPQCVVSSLRCNGKNITLNSSTVELKYDGAYYIGSFNGIIDQGKKSYSVTITDPQGNEILTRSYDRMIDEWGVIVESFGNATNSSRDKYGPAIEGDIITLRAYTNIYTTNNNGTLDRDPDDPIVGTVTFGPNLMKETVHVSVNGKKLGDYVTDKNGLFNISTTDFGLDFDKTTEANMTFTTDVTSGEDSKVQRVLPHGYTEVMSSSAGEPNGNLSVLYNNTVKGEKKLLQSWDMSKEVASGETYFETEIKDLNATLESGLYTFNARYTCDSGNFRNATEEQYSGKAMVVGPEGFTATDIIKGSMNGTLEAIVRSVGTVIDRGTVTVWYQPAGGNKTELTKQNVDENNSWSDYWLDLNVSSLPNGKYTFTVEYICPDGTLMNSTCERVIEIGAGDNPDKEDAGVSFAEGDSIEKVITDEPFTLNVTASNPGEGGTWAFTSSNEAVASVSDRGEVTLLGIGVTNITAEYSSATTYGKASLLLKVSGSGNGNTVGGIEVPAGTKIETIFMEFGTGSSGAALNLSIVYTQNVTFTGSKFKAKDIEDLGNGTYRLGGVVIQLNSSLTEVAKPNFKFKNIKYASDNPKCKKQPCFIISFKANSGISKENKTDVKTANKVLKKKPVEFRIEQADLSGADLNDSKVFLNSKGNKVKKAETSLSGNKLTLKKKDYDAAIKDTTVDLTGKGNYKNTVTLPKS